MASQSSGHSGIRPFRCAFCGNRFKSYLLLVEHKIHTKFNHFYCRRCNLDFPTAAELHQHLDAPLSIILHESDGRVRCSSCNVCYDTMSDFDSHFNQRHFRGCTNCHLEFHNGIALQRHREKSHPSLNSTMTEGPTVAGLGSGTNSSIPPNEEREVIPYSATKHSDGRVENDSPESSAPVTAPSYPPSQEVAGLPVSNSLLPYVAPPAQETGSIINGPIVDISRGDNLPQGVQTEEAEDESRRGGQALSTDNVPNAPRNGPFTRTHLRLHYCGKCNTGFPSQPDLREHLDHSEPIRFPASDGGYRCFVCHTIFSSVEAFKNHVQIMDRSHEYLLAKWCIPCLLKFHTRTGFEKHKQTVHGAPSVSGPGESLSLTANRSGSAPVSTPPTELLSAEMKNPRPLDVLFSSLLPPASNPVLVASEVSQEMGRSSNTIATASTSAAVQAARTSLSPSVPPTTSFSAFPRRFGEYPRRRFDLFCIRCQVGFSTREEQREHVRRGIPATAPDKNHPENLVCSQCNLSSHSIDAMKIHLGLHAATCADCMVYFHNPRGLQEHRESQHPPDPVGQGASPQVEIPSGTTACTNVQGPLGRMEVTSATQDCNASASRDDSDASPLVNPAASSRSVPSQTPSTQPTERGRVEVIDTSASDSTQGPDLHRAPQRAELSSSSSSTSSPGPPSQVSLPSRLDTLFCRKCKMRFDTSEEQKTHVRNGMSTIKETEDSQGSITCAQCNKRFPEIRALKHHLRVHSFTCVSCLLYFHTSWAIRAHRQTLHTEISSNDNDQLAEPLNSEPTTTPQAPELTSVAQAVEPEDRLPATPSLSPAPRTSGRRQPAPRAQRVVRQISLQDFSDTDEDDNPEDLDNSDLGGWDRTDIQPQRPLEPTARPARTAGNVSGRHLQPTGRRTGEGQRWWWGGPPQVASWADLASGRPPQNTGPGIVGAPATSNAIAANPKVPRISSIAVQCIICLEEPAVDLTSTPCGHVGCEACLRQAVQTKPECPHCRKPMRLSELRALYL